MSPQARDALEAIRNSDASGINHDDIYGQGNLDACCRILAREYARYPQGDIVPDLAMLARRLCYQLRGTDNPVAEKAMEFLKKHGLQGNVIRTMEPE